MQHAEPKVTLNITLPANIAQMVEAHVLSGEYKSSSEVVGEALCAWDQKEKDHHLRLEHLRARIQSSIDDPRPRLSQEEMAQYFEARHQKRLQG